jgi:uncharacterized membrane protein
MRPSTPQRRSSAEIGRRRVWSDRDLEQLIGRLLQGGVVVASVVVIVGGVMLLWRHGAEQPAFSVFRGESSTLRSVGATLRGVLAGDPRAIVQLGLVLLIATPVARGALTLAAFAAQRDRVYVAMTGVVLVRLLVGLMS